MVWKYIFCCNIYLYLIDILSAINCLCDVTFTFSGPETTFKYFTDPWNVSGFMSMIAIHYILKGGINGWLVKDPGVDPGCIQAVREFYNSMWQKVSLI